MTDMTYGPSKEEIEAAAKAIYRACCTYYGDPIMPDRPTSDSDEILAEAALRAAAKVRGGRVVAKKINHEALENASELAFIIFDEQGFPLGDKSAQDIAEEIISRYLEMESYYSMEKE